MYCEKNVKYLCHKINKITFTVVGNYNKNSYWIENTVKYVK